VLATRAGANAIEACQPLFAALRALEAELNAEPRPPAYAGHPHPINLNIGVFSGGDWPSTVPAFACFDCRLSFFPGVSCAEMRRRVEEVVSRAAMGDSWLRASPPRVVFHGFRSEGHALPAGLPMVDVLTGCHRELCGAEPEEYIATCTTDLRAFVHFGRGQATCYGPVAHNIHAANERVLIDSVAHTAKAYALFLARWCGLAE